MPVEAGEEGQGHGQPGLGLPAARVERLLGEDDRVRVAKGGARVEWSPAGLVLAPPALRLAVDGDPIASPGNLRVDAEASFRRIVVTSGSGSGRGRPRP